MAARDETVVNLQNCRQLSQVAWTFRKKDFLPGQLAYDLYVNQADSMDWRRMDEQERRTVLELGRRFGMPRLRCLLRIRDADVR